MSTPLEQAERVPGKTVQRWMLEPRGRLAFRVRKGQVARVIDVDGQQVADLVCFNEQDTSEKLSTNNTALLQGNIYLTVGHSLLSDRANKMFTIIADTCGRHDLLAGSCSDGTNYVRYGVKGTPNCRDNLRMALEPFGIPLKEIPYSFNIFMNVPVGEDGSIKIVEPISRPGDYIDLRAEMDMIVGISNCPQERNPCNAYSPTRLEVIVYEPD